MTGEKVTVAEPLVGTALTEVKTVVNGKIGAVNLEANAVETTKIKEEAVTGAKLAVNKEAYGVLTERAEKTLFEASATTLTWVSVVLSLGAGNAESTFSFLVGGVTMGELIVKESTKTAWGFFVPKAKKWEWSPSKALHTTVFSSYLPFG